MRHLLYLLGATFLLVGCGVIGNDAPNTVEECPVTAESWGERRNDHHRKVLFVTLKNGSDDTIQLRDGGLEVTLVDQYQTHDPDTTRDLVVYMDVCCSPTEQKVRPGETIQIIDLIFDHAVDGHGHIVSPEGATPDHIRTDGREEGINITDNQTPCLLNP